ncbi:hypothetical protein GOQ27_05560 [Clostridium sp. D2Q-11]|uniref:Uncharacterized protein n=1 Tax=Anaeromonas frigoriresistens TaxID=2683708 RepID=A0A942URL9_9FIRM|nr:hypothetical protein [Anaeromonas frigoriresistens]MBS4537918.1 hypothetical protein [Anaeromonas frigoriresistens]
MNKILGGLFLILVVFSLFDPLKFLGLRPLTNVEKEVEFFKTFSIEDYLNKEYNKLFVDIHKGKQINKEVKIILI